MKEVQRERDRKREGEMEGGRGRGRGREREMERVRDLESKRETFKGLPQEMFKVNFIIT